MEVIERRAIRERGNGVRLKQRARRGAREREREREGARERERVQVSSLSCRNDFV